MSDTNEKSGGLSLEQKQWTRYTKNRPALDLINKVHPGINGSSGTTQELLKHVSPKDMIAPQE